MNENVHNATYNNRYEYPHFDINLCWLCVSIFLNPIKNNIRWCPLSCVRAHNANVCMLFSYYRLSVSSTFRDADISARCLCLRFLSFIYFFFIYSL